MNDFTKEELEEIGECVWIHNDLRDNDPETYSPLLKKIQSMIDNYCDHKEKETIQLRHSGTTFQSKCKKCKRIV